MFKVKKNRSIIIFEYNDSIRRVREKNESSYYYYYYYTFAVAWNRLHYPTNRSREYVFPARTISIIPRDDVSSLPLSYTRQQ